MKLLRNRFRGWAPQVPVHEHGGRDGHDDGEVLVVRVHDPEGLHGAREAREREHVPAPVGSSALEHSVKNAIANYPQNSDTR